MVEINPSVDNLTCKQIEGAPLMFRVIKKFGVSLIVLGLLTATFTYWYNSRVYDDITAVTLPEPDEASLAADAPSGELGKVEVSYLNYIKKKNESGSKNAQGLEIHISSMQYSQISESGVITERNIGDRN